MLHAAKVAASETYHRARASSHRHRYLVRQWGRRYVRVPLSASAAGGGQSGGGGCAGGQGAQHPARRVGDLAGGTARFRHLLRAGVGHHRSQRGTAEPTRPVFLVQLAFFAADGGLVPYTLATKWQAGAMPALLFAVAMGLHIFATDHVLAEHFPVRLTGRWRFALAGGALTGWLVAVAVQPTGTPLINTLTAFLGGAILLNVFIDELPPERHSSFGWFVSGLVAYTLLLIFATVAGKPGAA